MLGRDHENDFFLIIDLEKKPPSSDSVSPYFRLKVHQLFDIWSEVRVLFQLGINIFLKFPNHSFLTGFCNLGKILLELLRFEYPKFTQQSVPAWF
jgi:hypothetical protein